MKLLVFFVSLLCTWSVFAYPNINFSVPTRNTTVFYGETTYIPITMNYFTLWGGKEWVTPEGTWIQNIAGNCPALSGDVGIYLRGTCHMNLVVPGKILGRVIQNPAIYLLKKANRNGQWNESYPTPTIQVSVVPHPLSMAPIAFQKATAGIPFHFNMSNYVQYYSENVQFGTPPQGIVTPASQNGLYFDPTLLAIVGKPQTTGTYVFRVGVFNARGTAAPTELLIEVLANSRDTPVFKKSPSVASVIPLQHYALNLLDLLEEKASFMGFNEVTFSIDRKKSHANWLDFSKDNPTLLEGKLPQDMAGSTSEITIIAHSNTGGDSLPLTIQIPVAIDPLQKPVIHDMTLKAKASSEWRQDLSEYIENTSKDPSLRLILEKVEPFAPWLHVDAKEGTVLTGNIPKDATGQLYLLTMRANTLVGGNSESKVIPLQIQIDETKTPKFKANNPILPVIYKGLPYLYDFVEHADIFPEFQEIPYQLSFAPNYPNPPWLQIVDNKLQADMVPEDLVENLEVWVVIKNKPGGESTPMILNITLSG